MTPSDYSAAVELARSLNEAFPGDLHHPEVNRMKLIASALLHANTELQLAREEIELLASKYLATAEKYNTAADRVLEQTKALEEISEFIIRAMNQDQLDIARSDDFEWLTKWLNRHAQKRSGEDGK